LTTMRKCLPILARRSSLINRRQTRATDRPWG
jgi:hypothetical protein